MKEIKAIIQPFKLAKVRNALRHIPGFPGMTVSKCEGFGHHHDVDTRNIKADLTDYSAKIRLEILTDDTMVEAIVPVLIEAANTGQDGAGLVWVTEVAHYQKLHH